MRLQFAGSKVGLLFLLLSVVVFVLLLLPPSVSAEWRFMIMTAFSSVCHQIPERSFHIAETSLAVCHRCTGIYAGIPMAMMGIMITKGWRITKNTWASLLFGSLFLLGLDWGLTVLGFWENTMLSRLTTGLLFGLAAGAFLAVVVHKQGRNPGVESPDHNFVL